MRKRDFAHFIPDELYLKIIYKRTMKKSLNLNNPKTFTEKIQWLKLHDRKPEYTVMVDKYAVKKWVADRIGEQYIIPTLGVWKHFDDIDFDKLPEQFVLKCTHDSGGLVIVTDKKKLDKDSAKRKLEKSLKRNYYWDGREWPYKNVPPQIIAEKYMTDEVEDFCLDGGCSQMQKVEKCLTDYKFFCFNGIPKIAYISKDHAENPTTDFFDMDYNRLPIRMRDPNSDTAPRKPECFEQMKELAEVLSKGIPHLRVDF